ncbi:hypothetical protein [Sporosarcina sp. FSL K6-3457]|uniref:hypothetical protein n=1 Tax=Sporosarcina sp. FSL K6-3457 TaxID=2978204 RepID=UPI0030F8E85D
MLIKEVVNGVKHYLSVESNYKDPSEGQAAQDAVLFEMGRLSIGKQEIDSVVIVSADDARSFANLILHTCDEIDNGTVKGMGNQVAATPSANEVAAAKEVLSIFHKNSISYQQAISLLSPIEDELRKSALRQTVRKVNPGH